MNVTQNLNVLKYAMERHSDTVFRGPPFNLQGRGVVMCSIFKIINLGHTLHEIKKIFKELFYVDHLTCINM